ncbi:MAG TPA: IS256 family transposase [Vicinamibacterales bacterium]|jgi:putative transposase|nr:IS256 family transposase [Vicinamibacterales bacterium]
MPRKPKPEQPSAEILAPIPADILDQIVRDGPLTAADVETATRRFKKALIERALGAELSHHLGYGPGTVKPELTTNHRNGTSGKTVLTDDGPVPIDVPRDREGTFEPQLIGKHERRFTGFDDKVIALYARGLTVREIQAFLKEMYAVDVSPDLISTVTDAVVAEVTAWQSRPLEPMYPVVFFDALRVKIRDEAVVRSKAVYLALAILPDGSRDILGIWIEQTEGAKFWMKVFTDLKTRGCQDILIAVTDGLKGMSEALAAIFPVTTLQTCLVHLIRHSLDFANWKERQPLAKALRPIYAAPDADAGRVALDDFASSPWGVRFPPVVAAWRRAWTHVIPFFAFPPDVRRVIYTTNALESVHARVRKIIKTRGHFPTDDAATKLIWLALRNITAEWVLPTRHWSRAMNQFAILYAERFTVPRT